MTRRRTAWLIACATTALACSDPTAEPSEDTDTSTGDGDGDPGDGDGDGDPGDGDGDGDGDPGDGDGDGDPGDGDGDGDPGDGDGDGDPGDGDGDPGDACPLLEPGPLAFEPATIGLSEFFRDPGQTALFGDASSYAQMIGEAPPLTLGEQWLALVHHARRPLGTHYAITELAGDGECSIHAQLQVTQLAANCDNFEYTRVGPAGASLAALADDPSEITFSYTPQVGEFDCELDGVGEFEACSETQWCAPGLICAGITRANAGLCMDASLRGVFAQPDINQVIAAADLTSLQMQVSGLATVDTDVVVTLELDHLDLGPVTITLTNPSGNEVTVWDMDPSPYAFPWIPASGPVVLERVPVGFSGDESVNGTWTLKIQNAGVDVGELVGWKLEIMSRYD